MQGNSLTENDADVIKISESWEFIEIYGITEPHTLARFIGEVTISPNHNLSCKIVGGHVHVARTVIVKYYMNQNPKLSKWNIEEKRKL